MAKIRRHIARLPQGEPFTTRDLLIYGSRQAVDQALCRLVRKEEIRRLARGVFFSPNSKCKSAFTAFEIAKLKAESFGRRIITYAGQAAEQLGIGQRCHNEFTFAINGGSSSFRFGDTTIHFRRTSPRKMHLNDRKAGLLIRALWHLGKGACTTNVVSRAFQSLDRSGRFEITLRAAFMPYWLNNIFIRRWTTRRTGAQGNTA